MIYNYFSGGSNQFYLNLDNITFRTVNMFQLPEEMSIIILKGLDIVTLQCFQFKLIVEITN